MKQSFKEFMKDKQSVPISVGSFILVAVALRLGSYWLGWPITLIVFTVISVSLLVHNLMPIKLANLEVLSPKVGQSVKVLQIADLHAGAMFRIRQVLRTCKQLQPDVIAITGDLWDDRKTRSRCMGRVEHLLSDLYKICQNIFLIGGNHDQGIIGSDYLVRYTTKDGLRQKLPLGVVLGDVFINGLGVETEGNKDLFCKDDRFNLLLCHHPLHIRSLLKFNPSADLVLAGDTHGGQIRLPFIGALFCPDMPILPELNPDYKSLVRGLSEFKLGRFIKILGSSIVACGKVLVYVCSGLGYSGFPPIRFLCRPQVTCVTISPSK